MKSKAVRLYGKNDLRLEEVDLPQIMHDEILAMVVSDSVCMSTYKAVICGNEHKRIPPDIDVNPIIIGHEFTGVIMEVGGKWKDEFTPGDRFVIQPALKYNGSPYAPGYSYKYFGGDATYVIIPNEVMELGCLLKYNSDTFFYGSLAEPMSCIAGAFHSSYHIRPGKYQHSMGVVEGGNMVLMAAAGPMGLGAIDYALHCSRRPGLLVVTDVDDTRLKRASLIYTPDEAIKNGVKLEYTNVSKIKDADEYMMSLTGYKGFDDVFVFAPVKSVVEDGDKVLGKDGCLNFFAGPTNPNFSAEINFYNVHYGSTHVVGTSGGNVDDMVEIIEMVERGMINPASMITHIGGLDSAAETTLKLPSIPGGKKLIYTNIRMELTAISDFEKKGVHDPLFAKLAEIIEENNYLWCPEAEKYLLKNAEVVNS